MILWSFTTSDMWSSVVSHLMAFSSLAWPAACAVAASSTSSLGKCCMWLWPWYRGGLTMKLHMSECVVTNDH
ncbi:hypothetical protein BRADI_3g04617v3 [Brachypodium distachyon]|uniref:Secreted protein n=1 Tax=Brachypodium distachyon TaxID=15368 RepID=A0A2K2CV88_BRADI|nr:hypothetical protein BRADI_3g04617v3 [Brachypodium distachyon]